MTDAEVRIRKKPGPKPKLREQCAVEYCDKPATHKQWCSTHYSRLRRTGQLHTHRDAGLCRNGRHRLTPETTVKQSSGGYEFERCTLCIQENRKRNAVAIAAGVARYRKQYRSQYPERVKANGAVTQAIRAGRLIRPTACERCGASNHRIEAHHHDYLKPLEVEWLCKPCHIHADKERHNG